MERIRSKIYLEVSETWFLAMANLNVHAWLVFGYDREPWALGWARTEQPDSGGE